MQVARALRRTTRRIEEHQPPGPFRRRRWRSPLRDPWLTSVFGLVLLGHHHILVSIMSVIEDVSVIPAPCATGPRALKVR